MKHPAEPITLSPDALAESTGGMKWQHLRQSYNVEDRRPGAPPMWQQKFNTWRANWKNGYWY